MSGKAEAGIVFALDFFDSIERANEVAEKLKRDVKVEKVWISEATKGVLK